MAATEEAVVIVTMEEEVNVTPAKEVSAGGDKAEKKEKVAKAKKARARSPPTHPPYFEMIKDAITTLKERNGSSQYAIQKFISEKEKKLPSNFPKLLLVNLRKFVASGRLVKVKASYKLPAATKAADPTKKAKTTAVKPKKAVTKPKLKAKAKAKPTKTRSLAAVAKAKPAPAVKSKSKQAAPAKTAVKPKPKAVSGTKRKATAAAAKPAKVAKTAVKATPSKKAPKPVAKKATPVAKKAVKSVKPKSVKKAAPAKRAMSTRGKK